MKDEEMAEEYRKNFEKTFMKVDLSDIEDAFLAGLKAGRPQWHDLRENPNDLPKEEKDVQVLFQDCNKVNPYTCLYDIHRESWLYYNLDNMLLEPFVFNVIAWCEIPTFDKE